MSTDNMTEKQPSKPVRIFVYKKIHALSKWMKLAGNTGQTTSHYKLVSKNS